MVSGTLQLIQKLQENPSVETIGLLVESGNVRAIPALLPLCFSRNRYAKLSREGIGILMESQSSKQWIWLAARLRQPYVFGDWGVHFKCSNVVGWDEPLRTLFLGLISCLRDGFEREKAVGMLADSGKVRSLPWLLLAANDHIRKISKRAISGVKHLLDRHLEACVRWLPLLVRLKQCKGRRHHAWVDEIKGCFSQEAEALIDGLALNDMHARGVCFSLLFALDEVPEKAYHMALQDGCVNHRNMVLNALEAKSLVDHPVWNLGLSNGSSWIRKRCLLHALNHHPNAEVLLRQALSDRHGGVRLIAQYYLKSRFGFDDFLGYYQGILANRESALPGALRGLADVGRPKHAVYLEPYLQDARPQFRTAANAAYKCFFPS